MIAKALKWTGLFLAASMTFVGGLLVYAQVAGIPSYLHRAPPRHVEVTSERVAAGRNLAMTLCTGCHLDPATKRLTGKHLADLPTEFGVVYSANITRSRTQGIGAWSDGDLAYLLRTGVRPDGRYVPPYMVKLPHLSDEELDAIIAFLRSDDEMVAAADVPAKEVTAPSLLVKVLTRLVMKPLPFPTKPVVAAARTDTVAYGRYLVFSRDCFSCHSEDFKSANVLEPEKTPGYFGGGNVLLGMSGEKVPSANLTPDPRTGIGRWSEADFVRALRSGISRDGGVLHYPMGPKPEIDEEQARAIYAYLRTIPVLENRVARFRDAPPSGGDDGVRAYHAYGCVSCHGESGVAFADLRNANRDFESDGQLVEWVLDAPRLRPGTKMPPFRGVIADRDLLPLVRHVRKLAGGEARHASL
jgi:mono/diheme cytochrome c family protein